MVFTYSYYLFLIFIAKYSQSYVILTATPKRNEIPWKVQTKVRYPQKVKGTEFTGSINIWVQLYAQHSARCWWYRNKLKKKKEKKGSPYSLCAYKAQMNKEHVISLNEGEVPGEHGRPRKTSVRKDTRAGGECEEEHTEQERIHSKHLEDQAGACMPWKECHLPKNTQKISQG